MADGRTRHDAGARKRVDFFPAAGGALGTVVRDHPALGGFPHEGFADLQFFNLMDGAVPVPLDRWREGLPADHRRHPHDGRLPGKTKNLSRVGYVFEAKVGGGRLLVTSLRFRDHFDEAYPEAHRSVRSAAALCERRVVRAGVEASAKSSGLEPVRPK